MTDENAVDIEQVAHEVESLKQTVDWEWWTDTHTVEELLVEVIGIVDRLCKHVTKESEATDAEDKA